VASWPAKQQESRHTTFGELKFEEKNMKNILFNLRVTAGKYFWSLSENISVIRKYFTCDR
jgi:ribosomal protein L29